LGQSICKTADPRMDTGTVLIQIEWRRCQQILVTFERE
jgi:hypothetical protein